MQRLKPISISPHVHKEIKKLAAARGTKMHEEADAAITAYIKREEKKVKQ